MTDNPFDLYTHTVCASNGDIPGWFAAFICAIPVLLVILDVIGGCR